MRAAKVVLAGVAFYLLSAGPAGAAERLERYVVRPGDTLYGIGQRYLVRTNDYRAVQRLNRIADPRPFEKAWDDVTQLKSTQLEAMQKRMTELGLYRDKIDGKAGMLTRAALGAYQKQNRLTLDCWPTSAVLDHMMAKRP